jgi:hypothetical protein
VKEAVEAAVGVARDLGLRVREPRVLRDVTNVLVHLAPAPVVARVPVTFARLRGTAWAAKELELVAGLRDAGLPVAGPVQDLPAGPHERAGFLVTLWEYIENDRAGSLDAAGAGNGLRRIHEALEHSDPDGLDHYARLDELAALVRTLDLDARELEVLERGLETAANVVADIDAPLQPVHGDAHLANVLRTPGGPVWSDFENVCLGPRELDLAGLTIRAVYGGLETARLHPPDEALIAYGDYDATLVQQLIPVHALFLAAWVCALAERIPAVRPYARERIGWVRDGFGL